MSRKNITRRQSATGKGHSFAQNKANSTKLRAREPIGRSFGSVRGKFPSRKANRMIHWESQLERDAVLLFEFSPGVTTFREQPLTTYYTLDGKTRRYTPDFELALHTGEIILIEIKPAEKLLDPTEAMRFTRITEHFASNDRPFRILTDKEIRQDTLLNNLRLLMRHRTERLTPYERRRLRDRLYAVRELSFTDAEALIGDVRIVWQLIDEGLLFCDLQQVVGKQTLLWTTTSEAANEKLYF